MAIEENQGALPPVELVASIFDAARDERLWADVVARMTAWVGGAVGGLQVRQLAPELSMTIVSSGLDPMFASTYAEEYFRVDPHLAHVAALGEGESLLSRELLADRTYRSSRFYTEWVAPQGLHDLQGATILRDQERLVTFATYAPERTRFDHTTRARLDALVPHLQRSLRVALDLRELEAARTVLGAAGAARRCAAVSYPCDEPGVSSYGYGWSLGDAAGEKTRESRVDLSPTA